MSEIQKNEENGLFAQTVKKLAKFLPSNVVVKVATVLTAFTLAGDVAEAQRGGPAGGGNSGGSSGGGFAVPSGNFSGGNRGGGGFNMPTGNSGGARNMNIPARPLATPAGNTLPPRTQPPVAQGGGFQPTTSGGNRGGSGNNGLQQALSRAGVNPGQEYTGTRTIIDQNGRVVATEQIGGQGTRGMATAQPSQGAQGGSPAQTGVVQPNLNQPGVPGYTGNQVVNPNLNRPGYTGNPAVQPGYPNPTNPNVPLQPSIPVQPPPTQPGPSVPVQPPANTKPIIIPPNTSRPHPDNPTIVYNNYSNKDMQLFIPITIGSFNGNQGGGYGGGYGYYPVQNGQYVEYYEIYDIERIYQDQYQVCPPLTVATGIMPTMHQYHGQQPYWTWPGQDRRWTTGEVIALALLIGCAALLALATGYALANGKKESSPSVTTTRSI